MYSLLQRIYKGKKTLNSYLIGFFVRKPFFTFLSKKFTLYNTLNMKYFDHFQH